ncbi:MAG TPA: protein translocase subunit SecD, partial [Planctomycetota bacterium]|nr:protein translocase subunit SecD [Planctomycetota bacterium]
LVYSVDFKKALEEGTITEQQAANPDALMNELIGIWLERIDPQGVKGVVIRKEGNNRVVIELPGSASATRRSVSMPLESAMGVDDVTLYLAKDPTKNAAELETAYDGFPATGGLCEVDGERFRYNKRVGNRLQGLERGWDQTKIEAHPAGASILLKASDPWRQLIENTGSMVFLIEAKATDLAGTDLNKEREALKQWVEANPGVSIRDYNALLADRQGPVSRLRWFPQTTTNPEAKFMDLVQPLVLDADPKYHFDGTDFPNFFQSQSKMGLPAVGFASVPEKRDAFGDFTEEHKGDRMAIVINDEIVTFPEIHGRLQGEGIIEGGAGGFTSEEVNNLVRILRSGSLRIKPQFEAQETVGATLGSDYVKRGFGSAAAGLFVVLLFMVVYYRQLGVLAGISLLYNLVILLGAMSFIQATLTLPGVAGIILTVGMAVDANILIYERIREEQLKGRKPLQSARDGFKNATSTIVDANLTTLITGLILYKVGSGPVRGFATTLCIGIITSMLSALVLTRVLVHYSLERGVANWNMRRAVTETSFDFLKKTKVAVACSMVFIVLGLVLFISEDDNKKLGIDFTGGTTMTIVTEEPQLTDSIRAMFDPAKNNLIAEANVFTRSVEVVPILNSGDSTTGYRSFRILAKTANADQTSIRQDVMDYLAPVLQKGPVDVTVEGDQASGKLYFDVPHDPVQVSEALASQCNVTDPTVTLLAGTDSIYTFQGRVARGKAANLVELDIQTGLDGLADRDKQLFTLTSPISELSSVGAQVVEELRDKAVLAIILSLFAAVMYIRVRFTEYSYGFAAVVALVHDVSLTLGAIGVMVWTGWVRVEIDLSMIAAFLTIIGYSLNDTIVVFDRVRENLPRMKGDMPSIVNRSLNQTLSRTTLTSLTTLFTVTLLFIFNVGTGNVIEGFSFAMFVGIMVGTYSSLFIASPALVWLETRRRKGLESHTGHESETAKGATSA